MSIKCSSLDKFNNVIKLSNVEQLSTDNDEFVFVVECNNDRALQNNIASK